MIPELTFGDKVIVPPPKTAEDAKKRVDEGYERIRGTNTILVSSQVPAGEVEREDIAVRNPTRYAAFVLREVLLQDDPSADLSPPRP